MDILETTEHKMTQTIKVFSQKLDTIRANRPSPDFLNDIPVDAYGQSTPLSQLANITLVGGNSFVVQLFDTSLIKTVEKSIRQSPKGIRPIIDKESLRVLLPELTGERRQDYIKLAKDEAEEARVAIRHVRQEAMSDLKKHSELSEDDIQRKKVKIQTLTDSFIKTIDGLFHKKEKEILAK